MIQYLGSFFLCNRLAGEVGAGCFTLIVLLSLLVLRVSFHLVLLAGLWFVIVSFLA